MLAYMDFGFVLILLGVVLILLSSFGLYCSNIDDSGKPAADRVWIFRGSLLGANITLLIVVYVMFDAVRTLGGF